MRFILAPDSFKESLTAVEAAEALARGVRRALPDAETVLLPVGDGGEGTMDILVHALGGQVYRTEVTYPLGERGTAEYAVLGDGKTAVVELARASGIHLVPREKRDPLRTTTFGTGELIRAALSHPVERLIVTIGGSATNDAGAGMLQALGAGILGGDGRPAGFGGGRLGDVERVDLSTLHPRLREVELLVACDVTNPLIGPHGASRVFGPQKGADPETVERLEANLARFADVVRRDAGRALHDEPGAGAAGGTGAALMLCGGRLVSGIDLVLDTLGFEAKLQDADYVFTGEGKIDGQTPGGKVIAGIVRRARKAGVPVIAFAGAVRPGYEPLYEEGLLAVFGITPYPCRLEQALRESGANLSAAAENVARLLARGGSRA
ncbi:MAG: glycerate kinase [Paenibacillaceae bacterium ZCTH02-B3]|nr:MAG: glycerate kinase [Paenibacillaceae bacterium ZCTH02-B3]